MSPTSASCLKGKWRSPHSLHTPIIAFYGWHPIAACPNAPLLYATVSWTFATLKNRACGLNVVVQAGAAV